MKKADPEKKKRVRRTPQPPKKTAVDDTEQRGRYKLNEFEQYALFLSLPKKDRKIEFGFDTDKEFAAEFQLHVGTLSEWKWDPKLWEKRDEYLLRLRKHTADILEAVALRTIKSGDSFHALNFMKMVEDYTDRTGLDLTSKGKKVEGFKFVVHKAPKRAEKKGHETGD